MAQQAQEDMNQFLRQARQSLAEAGEPITVVNLAHREGIARDAIYDHHPEWVDKVRAFEDEENGVRRELERVLSEGGVSPWSNSASVLVSLAPRFTGGFRRWWPL